MIQYLIKYLVFFIFLKNSNSTPISVCNYGVTFRDSKSCSKYYVCVKNDDKYWSLEEKHCPDFLFFEPSLNQCKPAHFLITECPDHRIKTREDKNNGDSSLVRKSMSDIVATNHSLDNQISNRQNFEILNSPSPLPDFENSFQDLGTNDNLKNEEKTNEVKYISRNGPGVFRTKEGPSDNENSFPTNLELKFKKGKPISKVRNSIKSGSRRKSKKPLKKKKNRSWITIMVRGCGLRDSYDEDEDDDDRNDDVSDIKEEPDIRDDDDKLDKSSNGKKNNLNGNNSGNNLNRLKDEHVDGSKNNLNNLNNLNNDNSQENVPPKNCTCAENNHSTTSKPNCDDEKNNQKDNSSTTSAPNKRTESRLDSKSSSTPSIKLSSSTLSNNESTTPSTINTPALAESKPTNLPTRNPADDVSNTLARSTTSTLKSTTMKPVTLTTKPQATTPKSNTGSKILVIPWKMPNPNNINNGTKLTEKEAIDKFLTELKKRKPNLSEGKVVELANLFKKEMKKNKELQLKPLNETNQPTNRMKEPVTKIQNLKADKDFEVNIEDFETAINYFSGLENNNSTDAVRRAKKSTSFIQKLKS